MQILLPGLYGNYWKGEFRQTAEFVQNMEDLGLSSNKPDVMHHAPMKP